MCVHFNPIVRVLEYEPSDAYGIRGRTYTRPLDIDFIQDFDNVNSEIVDDMVRVFERIGRRGRCHRRRFDRTVLFDDVYIGSYS